MPHEYCANCDQLQEQCARLTQDKTTAEMARDRLQKEVSRLAEENRRLISVIENMGEGNDAKPEQPEKHSSLIEDIENALRVVARVILKLSARHSSERMMDQIPNADLDFLEKLVNR